MPSRIEELAHELGIADRWLNEGIVDLFAATFTRDALTLDDVAEHLIVGGAARAILDDAGSNEARVARIAGLAGMAMVIGANLERRRLKATP